MAELDFALTVPSRGVHAALRIGAGEVHALIGPNGSGKSTVAGVIAGLVAPQPAMIRIGERVITDTERRIAVATHDRRVGLLQQAALLFPHLSVIENVAFAARQAPHRRRDDAGARAARWLADVDAADLAHRRPADLSGGEAKRVAVARALAAEPEVLLLDEPLAGLDVAVAASVRAMLSRVLATGGRPSVLITHDVLDIVTLADRVAVLEDGRITETGSAAAVLAAPRSRFAARFAGVNVVRGVTVGPGVLRDAAQQIWHGAGDTVLEPGERAVAVFSPAAVAVYRSRPEGSPRNSVRVRMAALESVGSAVRVRATEQADGDPGLAADITPDAVAELGLTPGDEVWFTVKTQAIALHPAGPTTSSDR